MEGIQEINDETTGVISPGMGAASTPVVVQPPVPPQFADEPSTEEHQEELSSVPLLNHVKENNNTANNSLINNSDSNVTNSNEHTLDRSMVSFLPMSASLEDDSVVNLTRF